MFSRIVENSHMRCEKYGISKKQKLSSRILDLKDITRRLEDSSDLILASETIIKKLYNELKETHFLAVLTDCEGCVLSIIGDEKIGGLVFNIGIRPGVFMDEKSIGTNAISLALIENKPIQLHGKEHYLNVFDEMTCSCVPIHDDNDRLIGTLDLSGYKYSIHTHILEVLIATSYAIEKNYALTKLVNQKKKKSDFSNCFYTIPLSAIIIDKEGFVMYSNEKINQIFGYRPDEMNIYELVNDWQYIQEQLDKGLKVEKLEVKINSRLNKIKTFISVYINNNSGNDINYVCYFKDIELKRKNAENINKLKATYTFNKLIGNNENFRKTIEFAKKISNSKSTVLLIGESGTGKEIFAQSIHNYCNRKDKPFIAINCGAIPENLIESELFGYEDGTFTGAIKGGKKGKFELADGGTIFLDEIGELPYELQNRLLRVIEEETISRIGGTEKAIDVRIIAASNKDLKEEVENKRFRKDLYYRLNVLPIYLAPLREKKDDIILLIDYYLNKISNKLNKKKINIPEKYYEKLINYSWPGNIRELQNFVELIINTEKLPRLDDDVFDVEIYRHHYIEDEEVTLAEIEKEHIVKVLKKHKANISISANVLGISRNTLYRKINNYKINCIEM